MGDLEFSEYELTLLDDASDFKKFLYSLHEEYDVYELNELITFYKDLGWNDHVDVILEFEKNTL
jgi:hypothetical protein